ncbi:MAG TPA: hypothetical protein VFU69_13275 [Ktedonobacterales bacterium]|nr:hypothetical protein [Ktedonobacterales bacterium]
MRATELLLRQCASVHALFHDVADALSNEEWTTRSMPETNLPGFDLWHVARTRDWALHTLVLGVPEVISAPRWADRGALTTPGIGVGMSRQEADRLAHQVAKADVVMYADAIHTALMEWLASTDDQVLDEMPDVLAHYRAHPEYLTPAMQAEVPWIAEHPSVWRCLMPGLAHVRDHLVEMKLLKCLLRAGKTSSEP